MRTLLENRLATLIWDGLPSRRSRKMKEWLATQSEWLVVEQLPAYGHDLNPIEKVWRNLKTKELADLCLDTISDHRSEDIATVIGEAFEKSWRLANGRTGDPILPQAMGSALQQPRSAEGNTRRRPQPRLPRDRRLSAADRGVPHMG
jgi:hypothetical protein